jgi:hypothetical protein
VPDRKPPRLAGDERETLLTALRYTRESFVRKLDGVDDEAARWSPVGTGTSLLWLTKHLDRAETNWVLRRFAGQPIDVPDDAVGPDDTLGAAVRRYEATWAAVDAVAASAPLDQICAADEVEPPVNLRWVLGHLLEETARHAGHADLLREQLDGSTGR